MNRIEKALGKLGYGKWDWHENEDGSWYGIIEFWTDTANQDVATEIKFDGTAKDFVKEFTKSAENYDVNDEVELFVGMRGKHGIPGTVRELLDDCQEAKDTLMEIVEALKKAIE